MKKLIYIWDGLRVSIFGQFSFLGELFFEAHSIKKNAAEITVMVSVER